MMNLKKLFEERKERRRKEKVLFNEAFEKERKVVVEEEATAKVFAIRQKAIKKAHQDPLLSRIGSGTVKGSILMAKGAGNIMKEVDKLNAKQQAAQTKKVSAKKVKAKKAKAAPAEEEPERESFGFRPEDGMLGGGQT